MNVLNKFQSAIAQGEALDWYLLDVQLDEEHARARTTPEREHLLALFTIMADMVERIDTSANVQAEFQEVRQRSYHRLLLREACLDGVLCAKTLSQVTAREVFKGRMVQDDPMRLAAIIGLARQSQDEDTAARREPGLSVQPAQLDGWSGGAWHWLHAGMASLAQRSATVWQRSQRNRTV